MTQKTAGISSHFIFIHVEPDQTIGGVTKSLFEKIPVVSEERNASDLVKQWNNYLVIHASRGDVPAYLAYPESPFL